MGTREHREQINMFIVTFVVMSAVPLQVERRSLRKGYMKRQTEGGVLAKWSNL